MARKSLINISDLPQDRPVLIAGPTASGKSALALSLAEATGRAVINADALQVYDGWRILTARPGPADLGRAPHHLYGHVPYTQSYSVGAWLRDLAPHLDQRPAPVVVGGTGLYFTALTEGLVDIPETPAAVRRAAEDILATDGIDALLANLDRATLERIDQANPARVQRAWEVQQATGRGIADWKDATPPPLLPLERTQPYLLEVGKDILAVRIAGRFDAMLAKGALEEARAMLPDWEPTRLSSRAIGAAELVAHLKGEISLADATEAAKIATRQYAKRQRSWFRARMRHWQALPAENF